MKIQNNLVVVRGGGDLATGVAYRLIRCGFKVIILEIEKPTVIRRTVAFAEAVYHGVAVVEGIQAIRVQNAEEAIHCVTKNMVPVVVDPAGDTLPVFKPDVLVDAILGKRNLGTRLNMAPIVVGLGPGFCAGEDVHAVIETNRGHNLGRVFLEGTAEPDTGVPGVIGGFDYQRILRAPKDGVIRTVKEICTTVQCGEVIAYVEDLPIVSHLEGVLRGLITDGLWVKKNLKVGDVDPRCKIEYCYSISDKARAIGGGVLEAILYLLKKEGTG
ncbi:molybdenum hydroxylase [Anaerocolumna cellulosilytica]|uniref:Molybdenum hydroxylase n=1 Tax=Anaerocolumna cellulosilytica TaxID=433286 RepID=A0A6S6R1A6_9FIRM|nr:selenium-dependent molybdenum cofactor biosynthesis protein YqeB [Anaerocolumna cellulosilytica]MBB5195603.1 xanthine dehydrogenase accessory factor [Anaerocolumna cellulosilytica]BCJ93847.1 molybdenum hydroxylase [Anaerocolumna cellulosilytica]